MTHYPSEFQSGPGFDTVEPDVFFSLSPVLLAAVLLLLALAIVLTWFARDLFGRKDPDAANDIWTAINTACLLAMGANSDQLLARARALREEITARLGPVLTLADGLNKPLGALDKAIKGKIKDDRATAAAAGCAPHVTRLAQARPGRPPRRRFAGPELVHGRLSDRPDPAGGTRRLGTVRTPVAGPGRKPRA